VSLTVWLAWILIFNLRTKICPGACFSFPYYQNNYKEDKKHHSLKQGRLSAHRCDVQFKPLSHQTATPQRLYSVLWDRHEIRLNYQKFVSYSVYTTSSQRPYSVHTTFLQRLYSVHDVFTAHKQLLQRVHSAHTARSRRAHGALTAFLPPAHSVLTAIIAFKIVYFFILFWVTVLCKHIFVLFEAIRHSI